MSEQRARHIPYEPVMTPGRRVYEFWLWAKWVSPDDLWDHLDEQDRQSWDQLAEQVPEFVAQLEREQK